MANKVVYRLHVWRHSINIRDGVTSPRNECSSLYIDHIFEYIETNFIFKCVINRMEMDSNGFVLSDEPILNYERERYIITEGDPKHYVKYDGRIIEI